jgi:hypothetical protein
MSDTDSRNQIILAIFAVAIFIWILKKKCGKSRVMDAPVIAATAEPPVVVNVEKKVEIAMATDASGKPKDSFLAGIYMTPGQGMDKKQGFKSDKITNNLQNLLANNAYG